MFICIVLFVLSSIDCLLQECETFYFVDLLHTSSLQNNFGLTVILFIQDAHAMGILHYGVPKMPSFKYFNNAVFMY